MHEGIRRHKILTKKLREKLLKAHEDDPSGERTNPEVIAKIFNPMGRGYWYLIDIDEDGRAFGLCCLDFAELGYVMVQELDEMLVHGLPLERDLYWEGNLEEAKKEAGERGIVVL